MNLSYRFPSLLLGLLLLPLASAVAQPDTDTGRLSPPLEALPESYHITRFTEANGLSSNAVSAVAQDQQGFMWIGTNYGLNRYDGYTTNVKLSACMDEDVIIADLLEGSPIPPEHGGPVRGLVPKLYAWKSIKWIKAIEFLSEEKLGFWELRGYSNVGDPWREMRFTSDDVKHGEV